MISNPSSFGNTLSPVQDEARVEQAVVAEVHVGEGTVRVRTTGGRQYEDVLVSSAVGGMPSVGEPCTVVSYEGRMGPGARTYLVASYPLPGPGGVGAVGRERSLLQGERAVFLDNGGEVLYGPDGTILFKSHPWAQTIYLPREHEIKQYARKWSTTSGPQGLIRYVSDLKGEHSFFELFLNDRFMSREGDPYANIIWTLGDNTKRLTSPGNPQSEWLHFYQIEKRPPTSFDTLYRYREEIGEIDGVVARTSHYDLKAETSLVTDVGHFDGPGGRLISLERAHADASEVYHRRVAADGAVYQATPGWITEQTESGLWRVASRSGQADVTLDGSTAAIRAQVRAEIATQLGAFVVTPAMTQMQHSGAAITVTPAAAGSTVPFAAPSFVFGGVGPPALPTTPAPAADHDPTPYEGLDGPVPVNTESSSSTFFGESIGGEGDEAETPESGSPASPSPAPGAPSPGAPAPSDAPEPSPEPDASQGPLGACEVVGDEIRFGRQGGAYTGYTEDEVHLGGDAQPAVLGDTLQSVLDQALTLMSGIASAIPAGAGAPFVPQIAALKTQLSTIKSQVVKLD